MKISALLIPILTTFSAPAMTVSSVAPLASSVTAGGFVTTLVAPIGLDVGFSSGIADLFQTDYPGFTYANAATGADGVLTISTLTPLQNGLTGGISIAASYVPAPGVDAPHSYEWLQYITIDPLTTPFLGATASPFTDPPPDSRDDSLPFYWTMAQRSTAGLGYARGGNLNNDPLFSDVPRLSDFRAPVNFRAFLYLADFDSTNRVVTVYDGVQYGFDVSSPLTASPEPRTFVLLGFVLVSLLATRSGRRPPVR